MFLIHQAVLSGLTLSQTLPVCGQVGPDGCSEQVYTKHWYVRNKSIYPVHKFGKISRTDFDFGTLRTSN